MAMQDDIQQFGKELIQWQGPRVLGFEQTLDLLQSEHRQIRMWAVYQLIECVGRNVLLSLYICYWNQRLLKVGKRQFILWGDIT